MCDYEVVSDLENPLSSKLEISHRKEKFISAQICSSFEARRRSRRESLIDSLLCARHCADHILGGKDWKDKAQEQLGIVCQAPCSMCYFIS